MKVLFDHQIFSEQTYGGISRYFANIIHQIKQGTANSYQLGLLYTENHYIKSEGQKKSNLFFDIFFNKKKRVSKWNKIYCKYLLKQNNFDVFHPTYFHPYFLKYLKKPFVITVHDMTYEALPELFNNNDPLTWQKRTLVEKADKIIAVSNTTKNDILKYLHVDEHKIEVVYHGIDLNEPIYEPVNNLPNKYILFVGGRYSYKNFFMLADAFKALSSKYPELYLVLAGGGALSYGDEEYLIRNNILSKTLQLSVTDAQLNTLYKNAEGFVFPSLYEGFGLPILEAFKNNCPTLLSDCSCFQEIAGDGALYFDHKSLNDLIIQIEKLLTDKSLKDSLSVSARKKLQEYPLEKSVQETIKVYQSLV